MASLLIAAAQSCSKPEQGAAAEPSECPASPVTNAGAGTPLLGEGTTPQRRTNAGAGFDVFGIRCLYPSAPSGERWTSEHWAQGEAYFISGRTDGRDPLAASGKRGTGTLAITGTGELVMSGSQPRLYIYPLSAASWRNVEVTVYYRRVSDDATPWGGLVVGVRSGADGHASTPCEAHTYYSRLRHDGTTDFEKELMHPASSPRSSVPARTLWPETHTLPYSLWIGWKYVVSTAPDQAAVELESYRDLTGGKNGGTWELVDTTLDTRGWFAPTDCAEHAPLNRHSDLTCLRAGVVLIRNTGVSEARYRWLTVREIAPLPL